VHAIAELVDAAEEFMADHARIARERIAAVKDVDV